MNIRIFSSQDTLLAERPLPEGKGFRSLPIERELLENAGGKLAIRFTLPILDIHGCWAPDNFHPSTEIPWTYDFSSAANRYMPFFLWYNMEGLNRAAFALTCVKDDARFFSSMSQAGYSLDMSWTISVTKETEPFEFLVNLDDEPFPDVIAAYCRRVTPEMPVFPKGAWEPVYCTWYAAHAAYTIDFLERNARLAKEYGFGTFILDDGWSYDTVKRLTPETCPEWFASTGSWQLSEKKLPGFQEHVKRVQALGLNYLVWFAPILIGMGHPKFKELKERGNIVYECSDSSAAYDPADEEMKQFTLSHFLETFQKYGFDGVKVDYIDFARANVDRPHGRAAYAYARELVERIRTIRPGALIEFRQFYATPWMLPLATQFRAADVPFDFIGNLHRCALLHIMLGDGVPAHADPIWFHPEESNVNVARHLLAALAGVPMISLELDKLSPAHAAILKRHVAFYHAHLATFAKGHWTLRYALGCVSSLCVETDEERIVFHVSGDVKLASGKRNLILNLSADAIRPFAGVAWSPEGEEVRGYVPLAGIGEA